MKRRLTAGFLAPLRSGLVVHSVLLAMLLVLATAFTVAGVILVAVAGQLERPDALVPVMPVGALVVVGGVVLVRRLVGHLRDPVLELVTAAARMRDGDLSTPIPPVDEPALAPLAEELELARVSMLTALEAREQVNRQREQLLHDVAHELRGPLAVLDNALEIMATDFAQLNAAEFDQLTGSALRTSRRLRALMEDLLSAGSIQSGRFQVCACPTKLSTIVDEVVETLAAVVGPRRQQIVVEVDPRIVVLADERYAHQVLANLLTNASKYGPEGDAIVLCAAPEAMGQVRISVADHGLGIPAEQQTGLFERFYRVRPGGEEPGIGLGLAIAKGIVEAHGGRIGIESGVGMGTTVWFTLLEAR